MLLRLTFAVRYLGLPLESWEKRLNLKTPNQQKIKANPEWRIVSGLLRANCLHLYSKLNDEEKAIIVATVETQETIERIVQMVEEDLRNKSD